MRQRLALWLLPIVARWQDRYLVIDSAGSMVRTFPTANAAAGVYRGMFSPAIEESPETPEPPDDVKLW